MARKLNKRERKAVQALWTAHDLLKGNGTARSAIKSAIDIIQDDKRGDLTNLQYDVLAVNVRPLSDPNRRGLIMRHGKAKGRIWLYRTNCPESGKQVEIELGTYKAPGSDTAQMSIADARAIWEVLHQRRRDRKPFTKDGAKLTLGDMVTTSSAETEYTVAWLCGKYMAEYANALNVDGLPVKRSASDDQATIDRYLLPQFGDMALADFTAPVIDGILDDLEGTPRNQQRLYSLLNVMNATGRKKPPRRAKIRISKHWIPRDIPNPMPNVTPPVTHKPQRYAPSDHEIRTYHSNLAQLDQTIADILALQVQTVARIGEVVALPWNELDLEAGVWSLPASRAKNKRAHRVFLSSQALDLLTRRRAADPSGTWVFPSPIYQDHHMAKTTPMKAINASRDVLGIDSRFTSHSTRRAALSWMKAHGVSREVRDAASNHYTSDVDAIYTESADMERQVRNAVQSWCDYLEGNEAGNVLPIVGQA